MQQFVFTANVDGVYAIEALGEHAIVVEKAEGLCPVGLGPFTNGIGETSFTGEVPLLNGESCTVRLRYEDPLKTGNYAILFKTVL